MTLGTDRALALSSHERVLDVATLLGEQGGLRDVRALLELPNDPLTRLQVRPGSGERRAGRAAGERPPARANPAAPNGTRLYGL